MNDLLYLIPRTASKSHLTTHNLEVLDEELVSIPVLGWTSAGDPIQMEMDFDTIEVPRSMVKKETFALRVKGNSMVDEGIQDGDIVIIERRTSAENGQSVIVRINQDEVTMKKLYIEKNGVRLQPANPDMEPIFLRNEDVEILGLVKGIVRKP